MRRPARKPDSFCGRVPRRSFLSDVGLGFTGLALGTMLYQDGFAREATTARWAPPDGRPQFPPKAQSVIWVFLSGGYSHLETFDPKPALTKYAGKTFDATPYRNPFNATDFEKRSRSVIQMVRERFSTIYPMQIGFRKHGESGIEVTDWWPHLAQCVDDICFVRSMYTTDNDHAAENQMHTGRHKLDPVEPSIGAWATYGLGTLNDNLPQFIVLGGPTRPDTRESIDSSYLGPRFAGVPLEIDLQDPLPYSRRSDGALTDQQRNEFELIDRLNRASAVEYPQDPAIRARIRAYELAFRMQISVPEAVDLSAETAQTQSLYGLDADETRAAGRKLLAARRLVERGVRFVQVYPSQYGHWDSHKQLKQLHARGCAQVDKPVAGLIHDLKRRGLLEQTLVVFCTEFGRTPAVETRAGGTDGRDHHPHGFTVWLAGASVKGGFVHGGTDELGFHAHEPAHYVTDLHATVLYLMGLESKRLEIPGHKRLDIDHGRPILDIIG